MVEWRAIEEFPDYEVSDDAQVRRIKNKKLLTKNKKGFVEIGDNRRSVKKMMDIAFAFDPDEIWYSMDDNYPGYAISSKHRIKNMTTNHICSTTKRINLYDNDGKRVQPSLSTLIRVYFVQPREEGEIWKAIPGYYGDASNTGCIRSTCREFPYIMKPQLTQGSYPSVQLTEIESGKRFTFNIHYLVLSTFHPELKLNPTDEIDHKDGNHNNSRLENLEYVTHPENVKRAHANGQISSNKKAVYQICLKTDDIIKEYASATDAAKETEGKFKRERISEACINDTIYKGFKWCFVKPTEYYTTDLKDEKWKQIRNYNYDISTYGRIKNRTTDIFLKSKVNRDKRTYINLTTSPKTQIKFLVHRLVAEAFIPNPDNLPEVDHIVDNLDNYHVSNLQWVTGQRNKEKAFAKAIDQYDLEGNFIKRWVSMSEASRDLGVKTGAISKCCNGKQNTSHGFIWKFADNGADEFESVNSEE